MEKGSRALRAAGIAGLVCLALTLGYFGNCVKAWYGDIWNKDNNKGLDATAFLETSFWEDASAIRMLNRTIEGSPVVLEANGDSYSDFERVSAMTGLPTVLGWYVHEWLWRGDTDELNLRARDIETIYTSQDEAETRALLEKYDVSYVFIGSRERAKYGNNLQDGKLRVMGEVIFDEGAAVIKVK